MGLLGILLGLLLLLALSFRGWSVLLLAPLAALVGAAFSGEPLLAHWTQTFMTNAGRFVAQFFPIFMLGAVFGKLMEDSGAIASVADYLAVKLGEKRVMLAVVLAGAFVTYGGVNLMVAFFVIAPMAHALFRKAGVPRRLMPATIMLGTATFTMSAMPGTPAVQNAIPMPFFGTTPFAAPGLGIVASAIMLAFGMWWLGRKEAAARQRGEGYGAETEALVASEMSETMRERANNAREFDPAELAHGQKSATRPPVAIAMLPLIVVVAVNMVVSLVVLPSKDFSFLAEARWGATTMSAVAGVWSVIIALTVAILVLVATNWNRLPSIRQTMDAGANAAVLPVVSVASLVGFGAVVAALPAFEMVRDWVLGIGGGPLVSLATATNILAAFTGSASGGLTIALDALGGTYMQIAAQHGIDPQLLHRIAVIGSGTLDSLPHNGAVVTLLAACGCKHGESYLDMMVTCILGPIVALVAVILLGSVFGSF